MGQKKKQASSVSSKGGEHSEEDSEVCDTDEEDIEQKVIKKIKALPSVAQKVQAIAINTYMIEKRELDKKLEAEVEATELKFRGEMEPFMADVSKIVNGKHQFTDADFEEIGELLTPQEQENKHNYFDNEPIEDYWKKIFLNHDDIAHLVEEIDEPVLKHLLDVTAHKSADLKHLSLVFTFSENEWFSNTVIHKEFELEGDTILKSFGDAIVWKKDITVKTVTKKNKKKEKKTKVVKQKSFFNFFVEVEPQSDDEEKEGEEETDVSQLQGQYELATTLYEVIPKSIQFYLGLVERYGDFGEDDDEDDQ